MKTIRRLILRTIKASRPLAGLNKLVTLSRTLEAHIAYVRSVVLAHRVPGCTKPACQKWDAEDTLADTLARLAMLPSDVGAIFAHVNAQ